MPLSRFSRRHERTFGKEKEEWNGDFRKPPKPDSYYTKIKGKCRWCGNMIVNEDGTINERKSWHKECATEYMIIYHSREQRAQLRKRDKGVCNHCGKFAMKWDVDHIKPLVEQKGVKEEDLDWSYYSLDNLQTLCKPCHRLKTNSEVILKSNVKKKRKISYRSLKKFK
jgi:5-methylcytosine-specific restriction endonuclease McrA